MSKQTRKKSPKIAPPKAAAGKTPTAAKRVVAKVAAKAASKPAKKLSKPSQSAKAAEATTSAPKKSAAKPSAAKPSAAKPGRVAILTEGTPAPGFELRRDGGKTVTLASFSGKKLVIFFYPRANTPGCTREAIDFTRLASDFASCGTGVVGVSADSLKAQESFRDKHQLAIPLLSDENHEMLEAYGAWGEKSMYGRSFLGIFRTTVLVGADGRIARIWRNVKVDGHAEQVLAAAKAL